MAQFDLETNHNFDMGYAPVDLHQPDAASDLQSFDLEHGFIMPDGSAPLDINDFLLSDLDTTTTIPQDEPPGGGGGLASGGSGGCCCGGS